MSDDAELTLDNMFPSSFLKASDLGGAPLLVTIESVTQETLKGGEQKNIMHLAGQDKALVLNKTNAKAIAVLYGKKVSAWTGKRIVLVPAMVDFKGDTVEAIRVKAPAVKKPTAPPPSQDLDDDIPDYLPDNDIEAA